MTHSVQVTFGAHPAWFLKKNHYTDIHQKLSGLLEAERDFIANAANLCALLYETLPGVNWVGFYLFRQGELVLGPFQGKVACVRIPLSRGVCGAAASRRETVRVENVHEFPGHVSCDNASNSEIVIPLVVNQELVGVIDLDSPLFCRFDDYDQAGLEIVAQIFLRLTDIGSCPK